MTYIMSRNGSASSSVITIERADITVDGQRRASATGTKNLVGRCKIVGISVVGA
jgi:hypothetical protein